MKHLLLIFGCIASQALTATTPVISVGDTSAVEGSTICVPLTKDAPSRSYSRVRVETHSLTALPGKDYVYTSVIVTLGSSQVKACASVPTIQNAAVDGSRAFTVAISPVRFAVIGRARATVTITDDDVAPPLPPATQTCPDGTVIPATSVCPASPPPSALSGTLSEGDSISVFWSGNHTGIYAKAHSSVVFSGRAVGGSTIASMASRFAADVTAKPGTVTVLIGGNDLANVTAYPATSDWLNALWAYTAQWKATGAKVVVGTILPQCNNAAHNARRPVANAAIRAAVGSKIDAVYDFAADPVMGPDAAACDLTLYKDGVHPTDYETANDGQHRLAVIYTAALDGTTVPPPVPLPPPVPVAGWLPSPSLDGLPAIASPFNISDALQTAWPSKCGGNIPCSAAPDNVGAFRFICRDSGRNNDDPIVYPGQPGASHGHQFYCHGADAFSTYANLRTGAGPFNGGGPCVNCSAYWMPQMLDGNGNPVKPDFVSIYYKRRPASDPKCGGLGTVFGAEGKCIGIPNGLRFIFGYDMLTGKAPTGSLYFNCQGPSAIAGTYPNIAVALANCPVGNLLGAVLIAPDCWDGKDLDSPNHRDHVAYELVDPNSGQPSCPPTHPYVIPKFTLGAWFPVAAGMHLSSDAMVPSAAPGTTFHGDYFEAWDPIVKAMWTDNCINKMLNCSGGDLGNGLQLRNAQ